MTSARKGAWSHATCRARNDEREHRYRFELIATDLERCPVNGAFTAQEVRKALEGHDLARASLTGTYTLNPRLASRKR